MARVQFVILPFCHVRIQKGWIGKYESFLDEIPIKDRYWVFNGVVLIKETYADEIKEFHGGS